MPYRSGIMEDGMSWFNPASAVSVYYVLINIAAYLLYAEDKKRAIKGAWRISEKTLLLISAFGGALGAYLGMTLLRHKTKHRKFQILVPVTLILHLALFACIMVHLADKAVPM